MGCRRVPGGLRVQSRVIFVLSLRVRGDFDSDLTDGTVAARIKTVTCGARFCEEALDSDLDHLLVHRPLT
jgi:hypothetical protein